MSDPQTLELYATTNARIWAKMFCEHFTVTTIDDPDHDIDPVSTMTTWFANAIETGRQYASPEPR